MLIMNSQYSTIIKSICNLLCFIDTSFPHTVNSIIYTQWQSTNSIRALKFHKIILISQHPYLNFIFSDHHWKKVILLSMKVSEKETATFKYYMILTEPHLTLWLSRFVKRKLEVILRFFLQKEQVAPIHFFFLAAFLGTRGALGAKQLFIPWLQQINLQEIH